MRAATLLGLVVGILLLVGGAALGVRERSQRELDLDHTLTSRVDEDASRLLAYFERARSIMLITAHNPSFREFYSSTRVPRLARIRAHGRAVRDSEAALNYLEQLYPTSIGEACFIDRSGPENARYVRGVRAKIGDLSPDESQNPFFGPTFALHAGQVFQARPYVSPDTHEWVISNSTPVPGTGFPAAAIVHYEITVESFRRAAAAVGGRFDVAIVDASSGRVVIDSRRPQRIGAPLGQPRDRRFVSLTTAHAVSGTTTLAGHRLAFQRLAVSAHNENDWIVVAVDPHGAGSLFDGMAGAPLGMAAAGLILILLASASLRMSRRALHLAAHTDALTGMRNRRQLMVDLDIACARAHRGEQFGLVLFDLDGFKGYNDSFGHGPGDALLRRLGKKLDAAIAELGGTAYRLGGDEFCALAPLARTGPVESVVTVGERALTEEGEGFVIRASSGPALLPAEAGAPSDVLATADLRMYANKQSGRPSAAQQTTDALVRVQQERSPLLGPHVIDVADLAEAIGQRMGLPEHRLAWVRQTAELHDVGKMAIPDDVLNKPGPLTDDEWQLMREHTIIGERIVAAAPALRDVANIVRATHERFDGAGYPDGLAGEEIPLEARIVSAADAYSAMTQNRPYREARSVEATIEEMRRCGGHQFDPDVVEALIDVICEPPAPGADAAPTASAGTSA
jgi:diguanylate cyclase (GGDEF)-like protein